MSFILSEPFFERKSVFLISNGKIYKKKRQNQYLSEQTFLYFSLSLLYVGILVLHNKSGVTICSD